MLDDERSQLEHGLDSLEAQARQAPGRDGLVAICETLGDWAEAAAPLLGGRSGLAKAEVSRLLAGAQAGRPTEQLQERLLQALRTCGEALQGADAPAVPAPAPAPTAAGSLALNQDLVPVFQEFLGEGPQLLASMEAALLAMANQDPRGLGDLSRALHTLKGIFGFLGLDGMNRLCHSAEDHLQGQLHGGRALPGAQVEWLLKVCDLLREQIQAVAHGLESGSVALVDTAALAAAMPDAGADGGGTVAWPLEPLADEAPALPPADGPGGAPGQDAFLRVRADKMDALLELVGELAICQSQVGEGLRDAGLNPATAGEVERLDKLSRQLQETVLALRLVPVEPLFLRAGRMAHDAGQRTGKAVELRSDGGDTELDKGMVEALAEPLLHLIRNAVDHGLELAGERAALGKPERGQLLLQARREGRDFVLELSDDGRGLDLEALAAKGLALGLLRPGEEQDQARVTQLIFESGLSTARALTDLSGRGVGMDAVKRKVGALKGSIQVRSRRGQGCAFVLRFPLILSLMEGVLVAVEGRRYVLPAAQVRRFLAADSALAHRVGNGPAWLEADGLSLPLLDLRGWFAGDGRPWQGRKVAVHVASEGREGCLLVDQVLGRRQVVVKGLGAGLRADLSGVAGGAILGDGQVGMILDLDVILSNGGGSAAAMGGHRG
ncbi:MAG TPA: chemotaxis protein CheW [bacterium]|nr:chemotaxis protein CheW [bacterium]HXB97187.1 chemotaxis protein CheW [bacterium]